MAVAHPSRRLPVEIGEEDLFSLDIHRLEIKNTHM